MTTKDPRIANDALTRLVQQSLAAELFAIDSHGKSRDTATIAGPITYISGQWSDADIDIELHGQTVVQLPWASLQRCVLLVDPEGIVDLSFGDLGIRFTIIELSYPTYWRQPREDVNIYSYGDIR